MGRNGKDGLGAGSSQRKLPPAAEAAEQVGVSREVTNPWDSWRDRKGPPKLRSSQGHQGQ